MVLSDSIDLWRNDLRRLLHYYEGIKETLDRIFIYLFVFFIFLNIVSYWIAMLTAFPNLVFGNTFTYYFKVQFPVGLLGALFDSLSFFITIHIIKRALNHKGDIAYIAHLSIDILIAILATFWVLFVFTISGWIVGFFDSLYQPSETSIMYDHDTNLTQRSDRYAGMLQDAVRHPYQNLQNIYFGLLMGLSAIIPTAIHLSMFFKSFFKTIFHHN